MAYYVDLLDLCLKIIYLEAYIVSFTGAECSLDRNENGSYRVRISADATKTVAELRRPLEELMRGQTINHPSLTPTIIQHLFSSQGINLIKVTTANDWYLYSLNVKIFSSSDNCSSPTETDSISSGLL